MACEGQVKLLIEAQGVIGRQSGPSNLVFILSIKALA